MRAVLVDLVLGAAAAPPRAGEGNADDVDTHLRRQARWARQWSRRFERCAALLASQSTGLTEAATELRAGDELLRHEVKRLEQSVARLFR